MKTNPLTPPSPLGGEGKGEGKREVNFMTQWKCSKCSYTFGADTVPERCPSCKQACTFSDVTCYIPDCGGPGKVDPRLVGKKDKPVNE
jgi:rubredoxin